MIEDLLELLVVEGLAERALDARAVVLAESTDALDDARQVARLYEAAAEFQKIIDHPGIIVSDPIGAMARLYLGRAWSLAGDKMKAKTAYQEFLSLWKDADPDIPILKQAKAEYATL